MCGIAAILLHPQKRSPEIWREIKENLSLNLLFNKERGKEATGLVVVQANGQATAQKLPVPSSKFIELPEYEALLNAVNAKTVLLMGHTRRPTQGSPNDSRNNHPLQAGPVLGVHNGHINNDNELYPLSFHYHPKWKALIFSSRYIFLRKTFGPVAL